MKKYLFYGYASLAVCCIGLGVYFTEIGIVGYCFYTLFTVAFMALCWRNYFWLKRPTITLYEQFVSLFIIGSSAAFGCDITLLGVNIIATAILVFLSLFVLFFTLKTSIANSPDLSSIIVEVLTILAIIASVVLLMVFISVSTHDSKKVWLSARFFLLIGVATFIYNWATYRLNAVEA